MKYLVWLSLISLVIIISCNKPSPIGAGFLEDDEIQIGFSDTFDLETTIIRQDSQLVYSPGLTVLSTFPCGRIIDPVFGTTEAQIYTQMSIGPIEPVISESIVDSIVLTLAYDSTAFYALDTNKRYSIEVHRVVEDMAIEKAGYSNQSYEVDDLLGGLYNFRIRANMNRTIVEPEVGAPVDTVTYIPHIRIPLSAEFGKELIDLDTTEFTTPSGFREYFKGLRISVSDDTEGLLAFDMNQGVSRVSLYYQRVDDTRRYDFDITALNKRTIQISHDYNQEIEALIDNPSGGDSLVILQGLAGLQTEFDLMGLNGLPSDIIINKAELVLNGPLNTEELFSPSEQLVTFVENDEGNLTWIRDVIPDLNDPRAISTLSGGYKIETDDFLSYRINLTSHIQRILDGEVGSSFVVSVHPSVGDGSRTILYGPGSQIAPVKLEIVYTLIP